MLDGAIGAALSRHRRQIARTGIAAALGVLLAVGVVALGVPRLVACAALRAGCATDGPPKGRLPSQARLTPAQVALSGTYVALGDSYSSGEGVYQAGERPLNGGADRCHRAQGSYAPQIAGALGFGSGISFWACSGATTTQLLHGQYGMQPQIDRVTRKSSLVTLSIGGNDAGFTSVLRACIVKVPWSSACTDQDAAVSGRIDQLRSSVRTVLREIRVRAPFARIIVVGYPRPFPAQPTAGVNNLGVDDQRWLNGVSRKLDDVLGTAVKEFDRAVAAFGGPGSVEFVDAYDAFAGHEVGTPDPYLNGLDVNLDDLTVESRSFHPTAGGYKRYAELVDRQIATGPGRPMNNLAPPA